MMKELTIEITKVCSLGCAHCSTNAVLWPCMPEEGIYISPETFRKYLREYPGFKTIRLSGGEPFHHPDLLELLKILKENNRKAVVLTSGVKKKQPFERKFLEECKPYVDELNFSVHGYWDLQDRIAMHAENANDIQDFSPWACLCDSVATARELEIPYSFNVVVMKQNYNNLDEIVKGICELGKADYQRTRIHFMRLVHQGRARNLERLTADEESEIPGLTKTLGKKYEVRITYTSAFDRYKCNCGSEKAALVLRGGGLEYIGCSALKENPVRGEFACLASPQRSHTS